MKKIILAICPMLVASAAFAGSYNAPATGSDSAATVVNEETAGSSSTHATGPYAGLELGWTKQNADSTFDTSDRDYFGGQANVGYAFAMNDKLFVGPELGWGDYGKLDTGSKKTTATDVVAAARYFVNEKVNVIGKAGLAYVDGDGDKNTTPITGMGVGYEINSHINADVTYYHMYGQKSDLDRTDSVFAGLSYFF
jgi:hypothetical protein